VSPVDEFRAAVSDAGMVPPSLVIVDGRWHRFSPSGRRGDDAGRYRLFQRGRLVGAFVDHRSDLSVTFRSGGGPMASRAEVDAARRRAAEEEAAGHRAAAEAARELWERGRAAVDVPYLLRKRVGAHGVRALGSSLLVPCRAGAELWSVQTIRPDGRKRFVPGSRTRGTYLAIRGAGRLAVCEGYATGATIHEVTGWSVAVAFSAGNLGPVVRALSHLCPVVCADDDAWTPGNPGLTAARACGVPVLVPRWSGDRGEGTDFNDLAIAEGRSAVEKCLDLDPTG